MLPDVSQSFGLALRFQHPPLFVWHRLDFNARREVKVARVIGNPYSGSPSFLRVLKCGSSADAEPRAGLGFSLNGLHWATNHDEVCLAQAA
jgi:hypothetical protein